MGTLGDATTNVTYHIQDGAAPDAYRGRKVSPVQNSTKDLQILSNLVLNPTLSCLSSREGLAAEDEPQIVSPDLKGISSLDLVDLQRLKSLAATNHVIIRAFQPLREILVSTGAFEEATFVSDQIQLEKRRIDNALGFLAEICDALEPRGFQPTVIKSLDHWPDLGSDLDLFINGDSDRLIELLRTRFHATLEPRSWGDRLASKWNFVIPGLPELVEVHVGRLGQTGEQTAVTRSLAERRQPKTIAGYPFRVAAPEDRIVISTLQRMYRHFYIRLCDIIDNAELLESGEVSFTYLHRLGSAAGIWEGISTYLTIVSEYVETFRGRGVSLPALVTGTARFNTSQVSFRRDFLRVPILPHSLNLYANELKNLLLRGEIRNSFRLSLLPGLATAAAIEQKLTGSDKGIW